MKRLRPGPCSTSPAGDPGRHSAARPTAVAYVAAAATTSLGTLLPDDRLHAASKHLVAPLAALDVVVRPDAWAPRHRRTSSMLVVALTGSAVGDHLMLAESRSDGPAARRHLRRGAAAFAVQQLGFLALMHRRGQRFTHRGGIAAVAILGGLAVLDAVTSRHAAEPLAREAEPASGLATQQAPPQPPMGTPGPTSSTPPASSSLIAALPDPIVATYGALLVAMSVLAQSDERTARGGRLFLASDALIVARRLLPHGPMRRAADAVVMATYTAALALLVDGSTGPTPSAQRS